MPSVGLAELLVTFAIAAIYLVPLAIVVVLIRRRRTPTDDPVDLLRVRFARGEIDESEFLRLRSVLRGH